MFTKEAFDAMTEAAAIRAAHQAINESLNVVGLLPLPDNFKVHDLEHTLDYRRRARGTMNTTHLGSFVGYANEHAHFGATTFVDQLNMRAVAVLNLGAPGSAGHADNLAIFTAQKTASFKALESVTSGQKTQLEVAEWLEDWADLTQCSDDAGPIVHKKAVSAVRRITIESLRKQESTEESLSASRSAFESVSASSKEPIPTVIRFACMPFQGLPQREFVLRLSIRTGEKPTIVLRLIHAEKHAEEMAAELTELVREAFQDSQPPAIEDETSNDPVTVVIGTYGRSS